MSQIWQLLFPASNQVRGTVTEGTLLMWELRHHAISV